MQKKKNKKSKKQKIIVGLGYFVLVLRVDIQNGSWKVFEPSLEFKDVFDNQYQRHTCRRGVVKGIQLVGGRLHSEFVCLLFLQDHRETVRFLAVSGVHQRKPVSTFAT